MPHPDLEAAVRAALGSVIDPEIRRPITELGMVHSIDITPAGFVSVRILLTVSGCPMRDRLTTDVTTATASVAGVSGVQVDFGVMDDDQRTALQAMLRGGTPLPLT